MTRNSPSPQPDANGQDVEAYLFQCGHEECGSKLTASTRASLLVLIGQHLKDVHSIDKVTNTLLSYLESTCVTTR